MNSLEIRTIQDKDYDQWLPLWADNNLGHNNEEVTQTTWQRLLDDNADVNGLVAILGGKLAGFLHYIIHPVTGHIRPVCYMQDVYVSPGFRQQGIAKTLIGELARTAMEQKWARIYWLAEAENEAAQALYKNIGVKLNFTLHVLPTS